MAKIIGMSREAIVNETNSLLNDEDAYQDMSEGSNPYGDGHSSERIVEAVSRWHQKKTPLLEPTSNSSCRPDQLPGGGRAISRKALDKAAAAGKE